MKPIRFIQTAAFVLILVGCGQQQKTSEAPLKEVPPLTAQEERDLLEQATGIFGALPDVMPGAEGDTPEQIALGKKLYFDTRLSVNNTQSCNTCHNVNEGAAGVDNEVTSAGADKVRGARNSPTVFNAGYHFVQFWDGRADDLKAQAKGPITNPVEMGMPSAKAVEEKIRSIDEYTPLFAAAFPRARKAVSYDNLAHAIAAFERTLRAPSRFDDYVLGASAKLTNEEKRGLKTFIESGCITCHNGPLFGGSMYQKLGLVNPYDTRDAGRFGVTKDPSDSLMFKVPSLRLISKTHPYFHDGSVPTLSRAIELMGWHQLGKKLTADDIASIEAFLKAL
ncbi:MAG: c-type cytochrome [Ignavibacteria bacterium]|nr:c-type cytochrome [Ignavibacteria bacterium]MBK9183495.1 c-type cytochrome [Ignavibacteria bacterium]